MDECIKQLESTTFNGRRFSRQQIVLIQETTKNFSALSRRELAHTVCELLNWRTTAGKNKIQSCLAMLENLESLGILSLPKKDLSMQRGKQKKIIWTQQSDEQPELESDLNQLTPIRLQMISDKEDVKQWNELLDRHHYLGYKRPIGPYIRYFILDKTDKRLGCLMFSYASKCLPCRDEWIGWQDKSYRKHLDLIINNNRFLIFPWIKVKNLASTVLSIASKQLSEDWQQRYGYCPVLLENFVDQSQFNATCYRAANWILLGETAKSKKKTVKSVYVYPLVKDVKTILKNGPKKMLKKTTSPG